MKLDLCLTLSISSTPKGPSTDSLNLIEEPMQSVPYLIDTSKEFLNETVSTGNKANNQQMTLMKLKSFCAGKKN